MSKTAKTAARDAGASTADPARDLGFSAECNKPISMAAIYNTMRILKKMNPGDAYYENYLGMKAKYGDGFFDTYNLLWSIGVHRKPKRILEIGTRTGISLCQLLSAMDHDALRALERVVCVDPFDQWTSPNLVRANLKYLNLPAEKVDILAMRSEDYFRAEYQNGKPEYTQFDFILVDGDHSKPAARADLDAAVRLIAPGGIIVFDDISTAPGECALIDVWEAWKAEHADDFYFGANMNGKGVAWAIRKS